MLKIRLSRTGKKKQPSYRVVVTDIRAKRDGRIVERIGHYNPLTEPSEFAIKEDRALHWLSVGAQPTDAVRRLLDKQGTFDRLGRMRAGESLNVLAAEVSGAAVAAPEAVETAAEAEETAEEETIVEKVVETVKDVAADVADAVEDAVETVAETVEDVVSDTDDQPEEDESVVEESEEDVDEADDSDEADSDETEDAAEEADDEEDGE